MSKISGFSIKSIDCHHLILFCRKSQKVVQTADRPKAIITKTGNCQPTHYRIRVEVVKSTLGLGHYSDQGLKWEDLLEGMFPILFLFCRQNSQ